MAKKAVKKKEPVVEVKPTEKKIKVPIVEKEVKIEEEPKTEEKKYRWNQRTGW